MRNLRVVPESANREGPQGFGYRLNRLRLAAGYNDDQLAEKIRCSSAAVRHWETGRAAPGFWSLLELGRLFNVSLDWLCGTQQTETTK